LRRWASSRDVFAWATTQSPATAIHWPS